MGRGENTRLWRQIAKAQRAKGLPCFHCGQPIDYTLKYPDRRSFSADHLKPYVRHEELRYDPGNIVSSHLECNWRKGSDEHYSAGLGVLSEEF